jgi:uncharacterized membrane protein YdbT with pleckstrin-like domain
MSGASVVAAPRHELESNTRTLEPAEARMGLHWIVFAAPATCLALSVPLVLSGAIPEVVGVLAFLFAVGATASACFNFASSKVSISDNQLLMKTGFIRPSALNIQLSAIEGMQVQQSFLGRLLGYGSIILSGSGGWQHRFHRISAPSMLCARASRTQRI